MQTILDLGQNTTAIGPRFTFYLGGMVTWEKSIEEFPADIVIVGPRTVELRQEIELPRSCVGVRFIDITGTTSVRINGGGLRKLRDGDTLEGVKIRSLIVNVTNGSCTVQPCGTGD